MSSDKSYVTLETKLCIVCLDEYDTGTLLIDTRLRDSFEHKTLTTGTPQPTRKEPDPKFEGWGMCDKHQEQIDDGFCHLIECTNEDNGSERMRGEDAHRTGRLFSIKKKVLAKVLNLDPVPVSFIPVDVGKFFIRLHKRSQEASK